MMASFPQFQYQRGGRVVCMLFFERIIAHTLRLGNRRYLRG